MKKNSAAITLITEFKRNSSWKWVYWQEITKHTKIMGELSGSSFTFHKERFEVQPMVEKKVFKVMGDLRLVV